MLVPYLTTDQFLSQLALAICMQVVILVCMIYFAKRQPTDYDTRFNRRSRIIYGSILIAAGIALLFIKDIIHLPAYYLNTYGTTNPTQTMLQTGLNPDYFLLQPNLIWGNHTFEQYVVQSRIRNLFTLVSMGLYFILYRPSSVKKWVKVRKFIGYALLLFAMPATIEFHYFSLYEFLPIIVLSLVIYLLVRTYKSDSIIPVAPESNKKEGKNEYLSPIEPEQKLNIISQPPTEKMSEEPFRKRTTIFKTRQGKTTYSEIILLILIAISVVLSIVFAYRLGSNRYDENGYYKRGYDYYEDWGVYSSKYLYLREQGYYGIDENLGTPVHPKISLYHKDYLERNGVYCPDWYNQPMYIRFINYFKNKNVGKPLFLILKDSGYPCYVEISEMDSIPHIVYWDIINRRMTYKAYNAQYTTDCWFRKHIIQEDGDFVYETIIYMMDKDIYDGEIEKAVTIQCPWEKGTSSKMLLLLFILSSCLYIICTFVFSIVHLKRKKRTGQIKSLQMTNIFKYIIFCIIIECLINILIALAYFPISVGYAEEEFTMLEVLFFGSLLLIQFPALMYVERKMQEEFSTNYLLIPQWLREFISRYDSTEVLLRACTVLIIYPFFYICTLPFGIVGLIYIIPAFAIFILILMIKWIINGKEYNH